MMFSHYHQKPSIWNDSDGVDIITVYGYFAVLARIHPRTIKTIVWLLSRIDFLNKKSQ